ncbi:hypothetical protein AMTR_s00110p00026780 [Amborella trichopoda]|uniref:Uncharacterized protein n=1 Tax=Amborella trichopoda TaxID=13333 RepID=W1NX58_AMBTC|nr:hypothetical protein AMTR_s00110p00026780 [Amborella trichopoda]
MAMRSCNLHMVSMNSPGHEDTLPMDRKPLDPKNNVGVSYSLGSGSNNLATGIGSDRERSVYGPGFLVITSFGFEGNRSVGGIGLKSGSSNGGLGHNSGCDNYRLDGDGRDNDKPYRQAEEDAFIVDSDHGPRRKSSEDEQPRYSATPASNNLPSRIEGSLNTTTSSSLDSFAMTSSSMDVAACTMSNTLLSNMILGSYAPYLLLDGSIISSGVTEEREAHMVLKSGDHDEGVGGSSRSFFGC